jgi:hypothetical protein
VRSVDLTPGMRVLLDTRGSREPVVYLRWDVANAMAVVRLANGDELHVWLGRLHPIEASR